MYHQQYNKPQGNGIFLSPQGDKYIGQWAGGKKHGKGRYLFTTGDFYDGEFCKNNAQGMGVYYHTNGNIFTGQWVRFFCVCDFAHGAVTFCCFVAVR